MTEFIIGTLASIAAVVVLVIAGKLYAPFAGGWNAYLNLATSLPRLQRAGIRNLIPSRSDYRLLKGGETIAKYLSTVRRTLVYVGFWHAKGIEMENLRDVLESLLQQGCTVELVLLSDSISDEKADIIAKYLGISSTGFRARLLEAWKFALELSRDVARQSKGTLILRSHSEAIYASCFIIDEDTPDARLLVDIKIFGMGRENSFAIELARTSDTNSLYERFLTSFSRLRRSAHSINVTPS